jgi:acyl-CoA synthetase (AMP-forming)/AMP-acid ligase II
LTSINHQGRTVDFLHDLTVGDVLREHRRSRPLQTAVVCGEERYRYPELDERVNRLANALAAAEVGSGDIVLWLGQNCHRVIEGWLACAKIGAVFSPANWRQSPEELLTLLDDAQAKVIIWQEEEIGATVHAAREKWDGKALWLQHDSASRDDSYEAFLAQGSPADDERVVDPASAVIQLYTAAFAGTPNGAQLSHRAILSQDVMIAMVQRITEDTVYLNSGPMFHMATLMTTFATFRMGGTNVLTRRVDAEELCRLIEAERCNYGFVMGPTAQEILAVNKDGRYDLSSLRTFGGNEAWNAMVQVDDSPWGTHPAGYGQTEMTGMLTYNAFGIGSTGTSGRSSPFAQLRIVDPEGNEVAPGETGEIVARGAIVTSGYHDRSELNAQRSRGGWWHTSDLGRREADGSITFVAPLTRIVKSAAENIYPAEVEGCLSRHPAVKEAAIIGIPDKVWTQRVLAVVVLEPDQHVSAEELIEHCRTHIASYKKPSVVEFVDALPRKGWAIDYEALDERFGGGGYPGMGSPV